MMKAKNLMKAIAANMGGLPRLPRRFKIELTLLLIACGIVFVSNLNGFWGQYVVAGVTMLSFSAWSMVFTVRLIVYKGRAGELGRVAPPSS